MIINRIKQIVDQRTMDSECRKIIDFLEKSGFRKDIYRTIMEHPKSPITVYGIEIGTQQYADALSIGILQNTRRRSLRGTLSRNGDLGGFRKGEVDGAIVIVVDDRYSDPCIQKIRDKLGRYNPSTVFYVSTSPPKMRIIE